MMHAVFSFPDGARIAGKRVVRRAAKKSRLSPFGRPWMIGSRGSSSLTARYEIAEQTSAPEVAIEACCERLDAQRTIATIVLEGNDLSAGLSERVPKL
jgi:hypothetical protein